MKRANLRVAAIALVFSCLGQAKADLITSLPGGTVVAMPNVEYFGGGPQTFGPGITWSSTNSVNQGGSAFGYTGYYGFGANGYWDGTLGPMAGLNSSKDYNGVTDTMTFAFSTPVSAVGGFLNYLPGSTNPTTIAVYDSNNNLIESANLTFTTNGTANSGQFLGFQEKTANISYFTLSDNYVGLTNLTMAVPEPSGIGLIGMGILCMATGIAARNRKRATAA